VVLDTRFVGEVREEGPTRRGEKNHKNEDRNTRSGPSGGEWMWGFPALGYVGTSVGRFMGLRLGGGGKADLTGELSGRGKEAEGVRIECF